MLHKLKTGCQWHYQPVEQVFAGAAPSWQGVYARFHAWRKDGSWQMVWPRAFRRNKRWLDCSSVQPDVGHTPAKNGGAAGGHQGRPKARDIEARDIGAHIARHRRATDWQPDNDTFFDPERYRRAGGQFSCSC